MSVFGFGEIEIGLVVLLAIFFFGRKQLTEWVRGLKLAKYQWDKPLTDEEKKTVEPAAQVKA